MHGSCGRAGCYVGDRVVDVNGAQNSRGCSLNPCERLRQRSSIAPIEVDVVARGVCDVEPEGMPNDECHRFGFERKSVLPTLVKATAIEQDEKVRCQALHAIGQLGKELGADLGGQRKAVLTAFRNGMADKINDVRLASILSLGELGREIIGPDYEVVRDDLKRATRSPQRDISDAATSVLKQLADQKEK